jgi:hypothetical protein
MQSGNQIYASRFWGFYLYIIKHDQ